MLIEYNELFEKILKQSPDRINVEEIRNSETNPGIIQALRLEENEPQECGSN